MKAAEAAAEDALAAAMEAEPGALSAAAWPQQACNTRSSRAGLALPPGAPAVGCGEGALHAASNAAEQAALATEGCSGGTGGPAASTSNGNGQEHAAGGPGTARLGEVPQGSAEAPPRVAELRPVQHSPPGLLAGNANGQQAAAPVPGQAAAGAPEAHAGAAAAGSSGRRAQQARQVSMGQVQKVGTRSVN